MKISHILELYDYHAWANAHLFDVISALSDDDLDRPFDIGPGSIRKTLQHGFGAERIWYERISGGGYSDSRPVEAIESAEDLRATGEALHAARDAWLKSLSDADFARTIDYKTMRGEPFSTALGDILVHVCDHGVHHRAQLANMTRHVGEPFTNSDYLFFRLARPTLAPPATETAEFLRNAGITVGEEVETPRPLSLPILRRQLAYNDWANDLLLDAAQSLSDEQLDREFEMGIGTFRKTMLHIESSERYWTAHWCNENEPGWKDMEETTSLGELAEAWGSERRKRGAVLDSFDDAGLMREVTAEPAPNMPLTFRAGETMAQIAMHGTHHRAQALNMLRHLADISLQMSFIVFTRLN